jgi:YD repeat-containing protein
VQTANRWKKYETDAFGNVTNVIEPNPQGGANHETTYAYDMFNCLTTVTMPRGGTTQTRSFTSNTLGQLVATVNPEKGTDAFAGTSSVGEGPNGRGGGPKRDRSA